jgi:methylglutamate dehydrogenase subunit D
MSDGRTLPLGAVAKQGRFGANADRPGVLLTVSHPVSLVTVIARKGMSKAVSETLASLDGVQVMWAGHDQYYVQSGLAVFSMLKDRLGNTASIIDQSHGRVIVCIAGPNARAVLAKGTPVDLHSAHFPVGKSAVTQMAHVGVHLTRTGEDEFTLSVFRGFSESFWQWLVLSSAEFGCEMR